MSTFMTNRPKYITKRIPAKQAKELKDFKLRVALGAHNAWVRSWNRKELWWQHRISDDEYDEAGNFIKPKVSEDFEVKIGNAHFKFYPSRDQDRIKKILSKFRTTVW